MELEIFDYSPFDLSFTNIQYLSQSNKYDYYEFIKMLAHHFKILEAGDINILFHYIRNRYSDL